MRYVVIIGAVLTAFSALAQDPRLRPREEETFTIPEEDDSLVKASLASDRGYTNGTRLLWKWKPQKGDQFEKVASIVCRGAAEADCGRTVTAGIGQNMYTPENLCSIRPLRGDRPYGGWLYGVLMFDATRLTTNDHIELYAGVIGRDSHADDAQIFVHKHVTPAAPDPLGWKTQMGEWAAFLATYERRVKLLPHHVLDDRPDWFDLSPAIGGAAGNVFINASASVTTRLGYNLPLQFINSIISAPMSLGTQARGLPAPTIERAEHRSGKPDWDAYVYVMLNASYAARNVFIDAEDDQYLIKRRPNVREHRAGATFRVHHFRFAYQQTWRSSEFRPLVRNISRSDRPHSYGMLMISVGPSP
jgi:hypothetical protein